MRVVKAISVLLFCAVHLSGQAMSGTASNDASQVHFSAEDAGVKKPVTIPNSVLPLLAADELVRDELDSEHLTADKLPISWFSASAVHLGENGNEDLVVMAEGPLRGANVTSFWVFRKTPQSFSLVLKTGAHDLFIKNARWKHYSQLQTLSATAVRVSTTSFRFDGQAEQSSKEIR